MKFYSSEIKQNWIIKQQFFKEAEKEEEAATERERERQKERERENNSGGMQLYELWLNRGWSQARKS